MKSKHTLLVLVALFMGVQANAQFWKKIKKTAENAVERTVLNKTDREVSKETDKTIDGVIKGDKKDEKELTKEQKEAAEKNAMSIFGGGMEGIPDSYQFHYVMDMQLTSNKEVMNLQYYIEPDAMYFGNAIPQENTNSIIIYDMENQAMVTFMDNNGQKMAMKMRMPFDEEAQKLMAKTQEGKDNEMLDANITPLPSKTILGYNCKGYQVKQKDGVSKIYITNEAPVSFVGMFTSVKQLPKNMNAAAVPFNENSMMMEMEYTSNKRKKDNVHMLCTGIEEKAFSINKSEYQGM